MVAPTASLVFWTVAGLMTAAALAFVLPRLLSRRERPASAPAADTNVAVYREQIAELDAELASGRVSGNQYAQARAEIEQRLLSEIDDAPAIAGRATPAAALVLAIAVPALAFAIYAIVGEPSAVRAGVAVPAPAAGRDASARRDELVTHLARSPRDGRSWVLLARTDFDAERFSDAAAAYEQAIAVSAKVAADPAIWCEFADALGMANGGMLTGKPRELVMQALARDPAHPKALEMAGSAAFEAREYHSASGYWRALLAQMSPGTQAYRDLAAAILHAERLALPLPAPVGRSEGASPRD